MTRHGWPVVGIGAGLALLSTPDLANASAWALPKGAGQAILKYEYLYADQGFDADGQTFDLNSRRRDQSLGLFVEYGLTDRITLQFKGDLQEGTDDGLDYQGRGPIEVGATVQVWRDERTAVSFYGGYSRSGDGRNAGYTAPGIGEQDWEVRAAIGRSFGGLGGRAGPERSFAEFQVARRFREGLSDEVRTDVTLGAHFGSDWMILGQAFGGITDDDGSRWLSLEASAVRKFGDWRLQAGWRQAVAGRNSPVAQGVVVGLWRQF